MKRKCLLVLLGLLALVLAAVPALASTVTMSQDLSLGITLSGTAGLAVVGAESSAYASVSAYAANDVTDTGFLFADQTTPSPGTASAAIPGVSWIGDMVASTTVTSSFRFTFLDMSGTAPGPFGSLSQSAFTEIFLTFKADANGGAATVTITPTDQFLTYGVTGQAGFPYFYQLTGYSNLQTTIYSPSNPSIEGNLQALLADPRLGPFDPDGIIPLGPFADFSTNGTPAGSFTFNLTDLTANEKVTLDITLFSGYDGLSQVPVPPAVWLFGSGLAGLLLMGRRKYIRS
jgi:hypothetical protein